MADCLVCVVLLFGLIIVCALCLVSSFCACDVYLFVFDVCCFLFYFVILLFWGCIVSPLLFVLCVAFCVCVLFVCVCVLVGISMV